jgi:excisionase family DNA binding protein
MTTHRLENEPHVLTQARSLLSPNELSAYLGVPLATIYRWRSRHEGPPGIRVGRHVRYRLGDVEHWLDTHRDADPQ